MSLNLEKSIELLKLISKVRNSNLRSQLLVDLDRNNLLYKGLKEIATNIIDNNLSFPEATRKKLKKHRKIILDLANNKNKRNSKKYLRQSGGFLPILIPAILEILNLIAK